MYFKIFIISVWGHIQRSKDNSVALVLSFYLNVGSEDLLQVARIFRQAHRAILSALHGDFHASVLQRMLFCQNDCSKQMNQVSPPPLKQGALVKIQRKKYESHKRT